MCVCVYELECVDAGTNKGSIHVATKRRLSAYRRVLYFSSMIERVEG